MNTKITTALLWPWFYFQEFWQQEILLWKKTVKADTILLMVRMVHITCIVLGFLIGILPFYPTATPPAILGTMLIAFIFGAVGYFQIYLSRLDDEDAPKDFDVAQVGPLTFYRPRSLHKVQGVQEEQVYTMEYEAKPWCDIAAWVLVASCIRIITFMLFHAGTM